MFSLDDTIVAIATAPGRAGIGIVRLSGPEAEPIAARLLGREAPLAARLATFGHVSSAAAAYAGIEVVDQVVATFFPAPHSYTGQDVVELGLHGNPVILARVVETAARNGARLAEPGEFTLRAYLLGKIDLVQAEAIRDLVEAVTPRQARAALDQLEGTLTAAIGQLEREMFDLAVGLEASLDFPDEGYHFVEKHDVGASLRALEQGLAKLVAGGRHGRVLREGRVVAIVGRPNVGKSSVFNCLHGSERAIVTAVPGTTRDLLTERCDIEGIPVLFVDTAGIRQTDDEVEREGVARARGAAGVAEAVMVVLDRSVPLTAEDRQVLAETGGVARLLVGNKSDLVANWGRESLDADGVWVEVSARTGAGLDELRRRLAEAVGGREPGRDEVMVTNLRHLRLLESAAEAVGRARAAVESGASEEFVLADLHDAMASLREVTGQRAPDALLHEVFSRFCIGK